jgi:RNA polymerase sigma-70 factor (ECF subfamily)
MTAAVDTLDPGSDLALARRVADEDRDALKVLMRRYNQRLYRTARSILKDDCEAEDVLQEAYLRAYRSIGTFRGDAKLSTWLVSIVVNEAIGRLRRRNRTAEVIQLDGSSVDLDTGESETNASAPEAPERAAMRSEARRLLERNIDALPEAFRVVFLLRAIEELPVDEVASVLGIPEATVRTRFFRARALLREGLARDFDLELEEIFAFAGERCDRIVEGVLASLEPWPRWQCLLRD